MTDTSQARRYIPRKPVPIFLETPPPRTTSLRRHAQTPPHSGTGPHKQLPPLPLAIRKRTENDCEKGPEAASDNDAPRPRPRPVKPGQRGRTSIKRSSTVAAPEIMTKLVQPQPTASGPAPAQLYRKAINGYPSRLHRSKTLPATPPVQPDPETLQTSQMRQIKRCPIPQDSPHATELHVRNQDQKSSCQNDNGTPYHVLYPELPLRQSWHVEQANQPAIPLILNAGWTSTSSPSESADGETLSVISEVPKEDDNVGRKVPEIVSTAESPVVHSASCTGSGMGAWRGLKALGRMIGRGAARVFKLPLARGSVKY